MSACRVIVVRTAGTNCDLEAQHAWERAGASVQRLHLRELADQPARLADAAILTLPGGFSYGDDIAAGRILAAQLERHLGDALRSFVERGGLLLGICNGFQALVKAGLLPHPHQARQTDCSIVDNDPPGFQDRWVCLQAGPAPCAFLEPGRTYEMPIAHGEGRVVFSGDGLEVAERQGLGVLRYVPNPDPRLRGPQSPANPNGSTGDIAGLCDASGRILGLMPHPERFQFGHQHPCWTARRRREEGDGLELFRRGVASTGA